MLQKPDSAQSEAVVQALPLTLQVPLSGMQAPPVDVETLAGSQVVPLFWLLPQVLPTSQSEFTEQLVVFGLPAEHVPATAVHCASAVHESARLLQVPDFLHCAVGLALVVQVGLSLPAGQVPVTWQKATLPQVKPKLGPAFAQVLGTVQSDARVHDVVAGFPMVQLPITWQSVGVVHVFPSFIEFVQVLGPTATQLALALQAAPLLLQVPGVPQSAKVAQALPVFGPAFLQVLPIAGQVADVVHAAFGGLLQVPLFGTTGQAGLLAWTVGQVVAVVVAQLAEIAGQLPDDVQTANGGLLQLPAAGQVLTPALIVHACPVLAQVPPLIGQSVSTLHEPLAAPWQRFRLQSPSLAQLFPATLQVPLMNGQSVSAVHTFPVWMLQLPANVGGGQVVLKTQVPSGSGLVLQPGGSQALLQVLGSGGIEWMLTQVCAPAPLQVCATGLQVFCVPPLQVSGVMLLHAAGVPPTQASRLEPLHVAATAPLHSGALLQVPAAGPVHTPGWPLQAPAWKPVQLPAENPVQSWAGT